VTNPIDNTGPVAGGGRLGSRIAELVSRSVATTHASLSDHKRSLTALALEDFFDKVSGEIRTTTGPLYSQLADHPDMAPQLRGLFKFLATGNGQWQSIVGGTLTGTVIGGGLGNLITNLLNPVILPLIAHDPAGALSPADAATAAIKGLDHGLNLAYEAAKSGIDSTKFAVLQDLAHTRIGAQEVIDLLNRGLVNDAFANTLLRQAGFTPTDSGLIIELRHLDLSPQELASLVNFGVLTESEALPIARRSGIRDEDFNRLVYGAGQPPGLQELLFAYRRGVIDKARLFKGVQQGPLRAEWFDVVESLGTVPMSTADAIQASIQGHLSKSQAQKIATENGLAPDQFEPLWQTAGSPPGPQEMLKLLNRGLVTEAEVVQALSESRLKNKYIPLLLQSRFELPTLAQILSMLRKGVITEARATDLLHQRGYQPDLAVAMVKDALTTKTDTVKELSLSQIREAYLDKAISRTVALARIEKLGYDAATAALELDLVDERRAQRQVQAVVTRVHREYVEGLISDQDASGFLHKLLVPADQITTYLDLWGVEKATVRRTLTEAQVAQALKKGIIQPDEATTRWSAMGYSTADVAILLALATPATQAGA